MDTSNWINLGIFGATAIAACITWWATAQARKSAREANDTSKRLLDIERERDTLERTPTLTVTKVRLHTKDHQFFLQLVMANMSKQAIQITKAKLYSNEGELYAESSCSTVIGAASPYEGDIPIEPTLYEHVETFQGRQTRTAKRYEAEWIIYEVRKVSLDYVYGPTGSLVHSISFLQHGDKGGSFPTLPLRPPMPPGQENVEYHVDFDPSNVIQE